MKVGDIVYVSNPDTKYEEEYGARAHRSFFGKVTDITHYSNEICVEVDFGCGEQWAYHLGELSHASTLKDMTLEEFSNKFNVNISAVYING